ncbi:MAG: hypothetical protein HN687_00865 [Candidatus Marinimicrobia bacterium]|jgi:hypothetical protein|nr:hypothetical protein [Candidatus Neomarinimicrobiota bacterium]
MRIYILLLTLLTLAACTIKPVETVYYEQEDMTRFTTKPLKASIRSKEIEMVASKECPGKVICENQEIKLKVIHSDRFSLLKGKDLVLETEKGKLNLNERNYSNTYTLDTISKDGTTGVFNEQFLIWISESDFRLAAKAKTATLLVGDYSFKLLSEDRIPWQIMLDRESLLEVMDEEQQREYGQYSHVKKDIKEITIQEKRMTSEAAESTWKLIQDSNNPEDYRYFLEKFPNSPFAIPAKLKLRQLEREKE